MKIPTRLLFAAVPPGAERIKLLVVPADALEPADVVEPASPIVADSQRLDQEIKGHNPTHLFLRLRGLIDKGRMIVAAGISGNGHLAKATGRHFSKRRHDVGKLLVAALPPGGQDQPLAFKHQIGRRASTG